MGEDSDRLSEGHEALIVKLMQVTGRQNRDEVLEDALVLYGWSVGSVYDGKDVGSFDDTNKRYCTVSLPSFERVKTMALLRKPLKKGRNNPITPHDPTAPNDQ